MSEQSTTFEHKHQFAIAKLREYAANDSIDGEHLGPFLRAIERGDELSSIIWGARLEMYCVCDALIDMMVEECQTAIIR